MKIHKKNKVDEQAAIELEQAKHFMQWVTMSKPSRIKRLDKKKDRKRPEFAFYYASGQRYTLELKRWVTSELRQLQNFLEENIAKPFRNNLNGTFALYIPFEKLKGSRITQSEAKNLVFEIQQIGNSAMNGQRYFLSIGAFAKIRDDGHRVVPIITQPEFPIYLDETRKEVKTARDMLERYLQASQKKFRYYRGLRTLVLDISQNVLDIEYHASYSKEGPGVIRKWLEELLKGPTRIDYVCLHQFRVWGAGSGDERVRLLTGHKYVDKPSSHYEKVWRRAGLPPIHQSFIG